MRKQEDHPVDLTDFEQEWFHRPKIRDQFQTGLKNQLLEMQKQRSPLIPHSKSRGLWNSFHWKFILQRRSFGFLSVPVSLVLALLFISGVVYAVSQSIGYIPGFGIVQQDETIQVLSSSVSQTRDEITLKVISAYFSRSNSAVVYSFKGIPASVFERSDPLDSNVRKCTGEVQLELPDGQVLHSIGGGTLGYGNDQDYQKVAFFSALPANTNTATFKMACIADTLPKAAPENWSMLLTLQSQPDSLQTFPILKSTQKESQEPKPSIIVSELIPTEDKIIVLGNYEPAIPSIDPHTLRIEEISFMDVNGKSLPFRVPGDLQFLSQAESGRFAYVIEANRDSFPITIQFNKIYYGCSGKAAVTILLKDIPADHQVHDTNQPIQIGNCQAKIVSMRNNGNKLMLKFAADGQNLSSLSVRDPQDPTSFVTTEVKSYGDSVNVTLNAANLINHSSMDLWIENIVFGPLGPESSKIELQSYQ